MEEARTREGGDRPEAPSEPLLPDYGGACVTGLVPALLEGSAEPEWIPEDVIRADRAVLLVLDGLGWRQLQRCSGVAPTLTSLDGGPATTVAPSTTAAALTSITTGRPPGEHGVVGYRIAVPGGTLNTLRWSTAEGDARARHEPEAFQPLGSFGHQRPPVVTRSDFIDSGFTRAHLSGTRITGYGDRAGMVSSVEALTRAGEPFVYAYWDAVDHTAHEFGLGERYEEELAACDRMVAELLERLPAGTGLVVTADHGQVEVAERMLDLPPPVTSLLEAQSGEARFRWLHARAGAGADLVAAATEAFGDVAWVKGVDDIVDGGWLGPLVTPTARSRLGDVAIIAREAVGFRDPAEVMPIQLLGRHGSLTDEEVLVPALGVVA